MMLEQLGAGPAAQALDDAVRNLLREGKVRTPDLGGMSSTQEVTDAIIESIVQS